MEQHLLLLGLLLLRELHDLVDQRHLLVFLSALKRRHVHRVDVERHGPRAAAEQRCSLACPCSAATLNDFFPVVPQSGPGGGGKSIRMRTWTGREEQTERGQGERGETETEQGADPCWALTDP